MAQAQAAEEPRAKPNLLTSLIQFATQPFMCPMRKPQQLWSCSDVTVSSYFIPNNLNSSAAKDGDIMDSEETNPSSSRGSPTSVRIHGIDGGNKRGPAFVGHVFTLFDLTHMLLKDARGKKKIPLFDCAPQWMSKILNSTQKTGHPIFRFFMEFNDAVKYMQQLKIPSGLLGSWHLAEAYEHFKENPQMFQFVPNQYQVKEAKKLLGRNSKQKPSRCLKGIPVFTAKNIRIAVATTNGIRWEVNGPCSLSPVVLEGRYILGLREHPNPKIASVRFTPYFFDKRLLDNILEGTVDQYFQSLIQTRRLQRRKEVNDDDFPVDMFEEHFDSIIDPPEVHDLIEEMDVADVPFDLVSKAAGIYFNDFVDEMLLGNRWIRKAAGIQPKFPYMVDSFEERTASAIARAGEQANKRKADLSSQSDTENSYGNETLTSVGTLLSSEKNELYKDSRPLASKNESAPSKADSRKPSLEQKPVDEDLIDRILPKITMIGFSMTDTSRSNMTLIKKSMAELAKEIERNHRRFEVEDENDPLFFSNIVEFPAIGSSKSGTEETDY